MRIPLASTRSFCLRLIVAPAALLLAVVPLEGHEFRAVPSALHVAAVRPQNDSAEIVGIVTRFHDALANGDSTAALALLAPDVVILESGDVERRDGYRSHHLPADIAFARAIPGSRTIVGVSIVGDAAWVSATSVTVGQFNGRAINSVGAELVVLTRTRRLEESASPATRPVPWQIRAIHWSSRRKTP